MPKLGSCMYRFSMDLYKQDNLEHKRAKIPV